MEKVRVELVERSYDIVIENGLLDSVGERLKTYGPSPKAALVSNPTVFALYGELVTNSIKKAGFNLEHVIIPDGEEYKNLDTLKLIYDGLLKHGLDRKSALIALGGGVVGDITGFAAATYMRGISYIQIPTTLLAQVDSSVGGKTGIDHKLGKNMIGAFWQPGLVLIDPVTLKTLPEKQILAGLAEVIKYGAIYDDKLFEFLEANREQILNLDEKAITHIIKRSCEIKSDVVSKDERESGLRAILNYGHTIGHAIETATGYTRYLHGEAVAIGMHLEAKLSLLLKGINESQVFRIKALIDSYGLPSEIPGDVNMEEILSYMRLDKKAVAGKLKFILPENIGITKIVDNVSENAVKNLLGLG